MEFDQKYLYLGKSAELYYQCDIYEKTDMVFIKLVRRIINDYSINQLISFGCGNSYEEMVILSKLKKKIKYTGIDFSPEMISLSKDMLDKNKIKNYDLVNGDFFSTPIKFEKSPKLHYFSGFTMCNLNSEQWIKVMNMLDKEDIIIFYVLSIEDPFIIKDQIEQSIDNICYNKVKITQYLEGLKLFGLTENDGDFKQSILSDDLSVIVRYSFETKKGESIKVQDVRIYSIKNVINFFQDNNFKLIQTKTNIDICLYVFQKL
jgi:SAM-dependent methyltransferase